ncbi:MAG: hypothetical protein BGO09_13460 [Bacteroidetes bacterium 47-18]|nr:MAG: hypothetical protein BGO09_13460 [Bacteroidetes bacterium 47-18]
MKNLLLSLTMLTAVHASAQQETSKEISIKEVTVYMQGARVYGTTPLTLQKGKNFIKVINLPNDLDENTYKISLDKSTTLLAITPQVNQQKESTLSAPEVQLDKDKKKLLRQIDLLNIQIKNLTGEQAIINDNLKISVSDKITPQEQLVKLTEFYRKRMLEIDNQNFVLNEQRQLLQDSVSRIDQHMQQSRTRKAYNKKELVLEILAEREIQTHLGVSYVVSNAGWTPSYDLKATSIKQPLEMVYKGRIYQRTGQDWNNVKLYVSTYRPVSILSRPVLRPLYVTEHTGHNALNDVAMETKQSADYTNSYQMRTSDKVAAADIPVATVSGDQLNIIYELKHTQTLYSQEKEQYVILDKKELEASYKYHAVPKVSNQVFLMAFIRNWQQLNLVSGEANIFFEDNYIGKTQLQANYIKEEYPIALGTDDRIVLKRTQTDDKTTTKTLNSGKWETESFRISIRNNTKEPVELEILDQLPISENSKITIKALHIGDGALDEQTGSILWNRTISSGQTENINFSYEIKYPKEMRLRYYNR